MNQTKSFWSTSRTGLFVSYFGEVTVHSVPHVEVAASNRLYRMVWGRREPE